MQNDTVQSEHSISDGMSTPPPIAGGRRLISYTPNLSGAAPAHIRMLLMTICLFLGAALCQGQNADRVITVRVDPRIEVLGVLQLLGGGGPTTTDLVFPYRKRVEQRFAPFTSHPAVSMLKRRAGSGFGFDAPVIVMLNTDDISNPTLRHVPPSDIVERSGGLDTLRQWLEFVGQFVADSHFLEFLKENQYYYDWLGVIQSSALEPGLLKDLESYYGMAEAGYHIILSPLTKGGFGPRIESRPDTWEVYAVASPSGSSGDTLQFYTTSGLRRLVWHEFAHSFVNPLTEAHWRELSRFSSILDSIADGLPKWYRQWKPALDEHIVRAGVVRMTALYRTPEEAQRALVQEVDWGFVYVPQIAEFLKREFETPDAGRTDFASFFPRFVQFIGTFTPRR